MYNMLGGYRPSYNRYNMGLPQNGGGFSFDNPVITTPGGQMNLAQQIPMMGAINPWSNIAGMLGQQILRQMQPRQPQAVPQIPQRSWTGWQISPWMQKFMTRNRMGG